MTQVALNEIGKSIADMDMRLINTDDSIAVFEDDSIAAVATWEPMVATCTTCNTVRMLAARIFGSLGKA